MASEASTSQLYSRTYISNGHLNTQGPGLPAWDSFYNTSAHPSNTLYDSAASLNSRHSEEIDSDSFPSPQFSPSQSVAGTILKHPYPSSTLPPRSRAVWQLSQSEPSLVLGSQEDAWDDMKDDDEYHLQSQMSKRTGKLNVRRRNTLHLDIPIRKVAHTREVEDEDPILMQGDSSLETEKPDDEERVDEGSEMETRRHILDTVVIVDHDSDSIDEQRGRSSLRGVPSAIWRGEGRVNSLPPPKSPNSKENGQEIDLRRPMHIACFARRGSECPHGAQCPYIQLVPSDPSTRPPPPKLSARLPPISYDEAVHPLSTSPLLASAVPRSISAQMDEIVEPEGRRDDEGLISGIQSIRLESPNPPSSPSPSPSPDPVRLRRQVLPSGANPGWSIRKDETGDWISVRNSVSSALSTVDVPKPTDRPASRGPIDAAHFVTRLEEVTSMTRPRPPSFPTSAFSFTQRAERLDSSSLQPHPLLKRFDLLLASRTRDPSSYPRHKVRRGGGGRKSRDGSELESEEEEEAFRRKRRRRSSASSISGKYAVPLIPPYRGKPAGTEEDDASSNAAETMEELDGTHHPDVEDPQPHVETGSIHAPSLRREEPRSNADFVETRSRPRQIQLSSPPTSPDLSSREIRKRQEETWAASARGPVRATSVLEIDGRAMERDQPITKLGHPRSLFGLALAPIGKEATMARPEGKQALDVPIGTSGSSKGLFSNLYRFPGNTLGGRQRERIHDDGNPQSVQPSSPIQQPSITSPSSVVQQSSPTVASPVSPSSAGPSSSMSRHVKSSSASSTATSDTISSSLKPGAALQRAIAVMASLEPEKFARLEAERIRRDQKHQQAQRLEKALESKRGLYICQLLGIPVSIQGEEPVVVALTDEERQRIEQEVETIEASLIDIRSEIQSYGGIPGRSIPWKECRSRASLEIERSLYNLAPKVAVPVDPPPVRLDDGPSMSEPRPRIPTAKERVMANMALFARPASSREDRDSLPPFVLNSIQSQKDQMHQLLNPDSFGQRNLKAADHGADRRHVQREPSSALGLPFMGTLRPGTLGRPISAVKPVSGTQKSVTQASTTLDGLLGPLPSRPGKESLQESNVVKVSPLIPMDGLNLLQLIQGHTRGYSNENAKVLMKDTADVPKPLSFTAGTSQRPKHPSTERSSSEAVNSIRPLRSHESSISSIPELVSNKLPEANNLESLKEAAVKAAEKAQIVPVDDVKARRRISMSNALPGEEASSQTMEGLVFDSDEEDADDSREYISAEEGFIEESDQEGDDPVVSSSTPQPQDPVISAGSLARPALQRKRSLTTTDLPLPQTKVAHRPSLLDDWTFNFEPRATKSPRVRAANLGHRRKLSQGSSTSTPVLGQDLFAAQNIPDSPPLRRPSPASPPATRFRSLADPPTAEYSPYPGEDETGEVAQDLHPSFKSAYHVVTSSANVLDEATNVIEYATARVMSGGVKIGSIIPRGQNGVIEEEEEDEDEDAEEPVESAETFEKATNSTAAISTQGQHPPQSQTQPGGSSSALPAQAVSQPHAMPVPQSAPITTSTYISSAQSNVPGQPPTVIIQKRTIVANSSPGIHSYTNSGSPVASVNGGQSTPIEYCGDFRTTGHCRFGPRCRYSHDIEPRVKSMNTATTIKYRPILRSDPSTHPPSTEMLNPLPPLPAGYQISNIMPQPHHIPGVPLSQQPPSPFVFSTPAAVAHPKTSPATTAAAARGELMADKEKATKILKSLGLSPHQAAPHQPAPVVLADGEISYNLNVGRSGIFRDITRPPSGSLKPSKYAPYIQAKDAETEARETQEMLITRFGPGAAPRAQPSVTEEDVSRSRPAEDEEDVWRVSAERQRHAVDTSNQPAESSNRNVPHDLHQQPVEERRRLYTPAQPPPSYSAQTVTYSTHLSQPSPYAQPIAHSSAPVAAYPSAAQQAGGQSISVSPEYLAALLTAAQKGIAAPSSHHPPQVSYASQPTVYGHAAVPQPQAILQHPQHIAYHSHPPQHQPPFQYPAAAQPHVVPHHHQQQQQQQHLPLQHPQMQYPAGAYTNLHHMPF